MEKIMKFLFPRHIYCILGILWTALALLSLIWNLRQIDHHILSDAKRWGKTNIEKELSYREWNAMHGGVYVPVTEHTPPNPHLSHVPNRDVTTTDGMRLTMVNPAYMTRQVDEIFGSIYGIKEHLTSLYPIRPENAPDEWEKKALSSFKAGKKEAMEIIRQGKDESLRYMVPFITEKSCLKCHAHQGYREGDIRGGLSVTLPMKNFFAAELVLKKKNIFWHILVWLTGVFFLFLSEHITNLSYSKLKKAEESLSKKVKNLGSILDISTSIAAATEMKALLSAVIHTSKDLLHLDYSTIMLLSEDGRRLVVKDTLGFPDSHKETFFLSEGHGLSTHVIKYKRPETVFDFREEKRFEVPQVVFEEGITSGICVPMIFEDRVFGVLIGHTREKRTFSPEDISAYQTIANLTAVAIKNLQHLLEMNRLVAAVDQAADSIVITDKDGKILYVNPAFESITGYSQEEALGKNPRVLKSGKQDEAFYKELWHTITHGKVWKGHFINRKKDGSFYEEDATISPVKDSTGKITSFVAVKHDVTKEKTLERQLLQAQKMEAVGILAGGVAHDFNNLLTAIVGYTELSLLKLDESSPLYKNLSHVKESVQRAAGVVRQLLLFSRKQPVDFTPIDLNQTVTNMLKMLHRLIGENIHIVSHLEPELWTILADSGNMEQVIMNLSVNAKDAMPEGGSLTIRTANVVIGEDYCRKNSFASTGKYVVISVADTGMGMAPEIMSRIFEPFFSTKAFTGKGTGLGLSVVYGIVKAHGGWITAESIKGMGSIFRVYIPAHFVKPVDEKMIESTSMEEFMGKGEKILVIEDDPDVRDVTSETLKAANYRVIRTKDASEAINVFGKNLGKFDLIVCDVILPDMNGIRLCDEFLKIQPGIPIVMMSGYTTETYHIDSIKEKGYGFIQKPFSTQKLLSFIKETLHGV